MSKKEIEVSEEGTPPEPPLELDSQSKGVTPKWEPSWGTLRFMSTSDVPEVVNILVLADKITPDEAVKRLNKQVMNKSLLLFPKLYVRKGLMA